MKLNQIGGNLFKAFGIGYGGLMLYLLIFTQPLSTATNADYINLFKVWGTIGFVMVFILLTSFDYANPKLNEGVKDV